MVAVAVLSAGCTSRDPYLDVSDNSIDFGNQLDRVVITVRNAGQDHALSAGVATLEYVFTADKPWVIINPESGNCGEGEDGTHAVEIDRSLLILGDNIATIKISSNGGSASISVRALRESAVCSAPPSVPRNPVPIDDDDALSVAVDLLWSDGASQCAGLTATYDVYFGTTSPPPFDHNNGTSKTWDPGTLANATTYYWRVVATDANGSTSGAEWSFRTEVVPCTVAPKAPAGPTPTDDASAVWIYEHLSWSAGASQCAGLTATYDVYFGTTSPPPFDHNNGTSKSWDPGTLVNETTYYWRVVAKDANGSTSGAEWSFTTDVAPCTVAPQAPAGPTPTDDATAVGIYQHLSWSAGNSQCAGLTATYDVYFGTTSPPPFNHDNGTSKSWDPGTLVNETTYYWRVVAKDANGSTSGAEWSFTTDVAACASPPTAACTPSPTNERENVNENTNLSWQCGDSVCPGLTATYDVYLGTTPVLGAGQFLGNALMRTWDLPRLEKRTTYYWQIVTKDANGVKPGPVWTFTTRR